MKNRYSFSEFIKTLYALIMTKIFYKKARLVRRPIYIRGKSYMEFKKGFTTGYNCRFDILGEEGDKEKKLLIGENCKIGDNVHIVAREKIIVGDNCLMASKVFISDTSHGEYSNVENYSSPDIPPDQRILYSKPVTIGENVWIGENVCILLGVTIGNGVIIGANSIVNKDVSKNCMVAGAPIKVVKIWDEKLKMWIKS